MVVKALDDVSLCPLLFTMSSAGSGGVGITVLQRDGGTGGRGGRKVKFLGASNNST